MVLNLTTVRHRAKAPILAAIKSDNEELIPVFSIKAIPENDCII